MTLVEGGVQAQQHLEQELGDYIAAVDRGELLRELTLSPSSTPELIAGRRLHVVGTMREARVMPGEVAVSPGFGYCQGLIIEESESLLFRHNLTTDVGGARGALERAQRPRRLSVFAKHPAEMVRLQRELVDTGVPMHYGRVMHDSRLQFRIWVMGGLQDFVVQARTDDIHNLQIPIVFGETTVA